MTTSSVGMRRNLLLSVTEGQLVASGPASVSVNLREDLARLEILFDRNIAGTKPCGLVFAPETAALLGGRKPKHFCLLIL